MPFKVAIVGRPNVGKSSLLNMFAGRRISIVDPTAGVTRDRISAPVVLRRPGDDAPIAIELTDTGGWGIEDPLNLTAQVERQIESAANRSDLILFVIDAHVGVMSLDRQVAQMLRTTGRADRVLLVANKVDDEHLEADAGEAASLGFGAPVCVSATTRYNRNRMVETIVEKLRAGVVTADLAGGNAVMPEDVDGSEIADADMGSKSADPGTPLIAIVGKRNAGKSTLVNALAGEERVIVSEKEGTTRDAVDVQFVMGDRTFTAIDTAGVRKAKSIKDDIDYYSHHRALRAVRRADVALLLVDATVPVSQVDEKLVREILKHYVPCVIVVNKWDLVEAEHTKEQYIEYLDGVLKGLSFAPIVFTTAKDNQGVRDAVAMALNLYEQASHRVGTAELNQVMERVLAERTPTSGIGKRPKVYYVTQLAVRPPTIGMFVNDPDLFDGSYERFMLNRLRDELPYSEVPIKMLIRARKSLPREARLNTP